MKIAICDDEKEIRESLRKILEEYKEPFEQIDLYTSGEELLECDRNYDLLF